MISFLYKHKVTGRETKVKVNPLRYPNRPRISSALYNSFSPR